MGWTFEAAPIEILVLLEHPNERTQWLRAAQRVGVLVSACLEPSELLVQLNGHPPDAVLLPLGRREEESLLLCRAIQKRRGAQPLDIFLADSGGDLVASLNDVTLFGAKQLLPAGSPAELLVQINDAMDAPLEMTSLEAEPAGVVRRLVPEVIMGSPARLKALPAKQAVPAPKPSAPAWGSSIELLQAKLKQALEGDYFTLLGVSMGANTDAIMDAFTRLYERLNPEMLPADLKTRYAKEIGVVREALVDAWHVLGSVESRHRYIDALHQPSRLHLFEA